MTIITGIIFGLAAFCGGAYWVNKQTNQRALEQSSEEALLEKRDFSSISLKKKLRDAIFDCEQNVKKCDNQLKELYKNQLDLVQDIGKKSHVEVKGKPLFFEYNNQIEKTRFFYYERDLKNQEEKHMLDKTKKLLEDYQKQINLILIQKQFFDQLIQSHQENIDWLNGLKKGSSQLDKINKHERKIALIDHQEIEEKAIYNDLVMKEIDEELDYQEECLQQYLLLHEKYEIITNENTKEKLSIEIQEMIKHLTYK